MLEPMKQAILEEPYRTVAGQQDAPAPNGGLVDLLLACPAKGYFVPIESESTDVL